MQCSEAGVVIALRRRVARMRIPHETESLPEIGIDYGFFGRDKEDVLPTLCVKVSEQFNWLCGSDSG